MSPPKKQSRCVVSADYTTSTVAELLAGTQHQPGRSAGTQDVDVSYACAQ